MTEEKKPLRTKLGLEELEEIGMLKYMGPMVSGDGGMEAKSKHGHGGRGKGWLVCGKREQ